MSVAAPHFDPARAPRLPRALLSPRHWPAWLAVAALSSLQLLPAAARDGLAAAFGELRYRMGGYRRGIAERNLELCFPELEPDARARRVRAHFHAWARSMADQPALWWDRHGRFPHRRCRVHGLEHIEAPRSAGRRVILLCAHSTAMEFGGIAVASVLPQVALVNKLGSPVLDWLVWRVRCPYGGVIERDAGLRSVLHAAREHGALFYAPDEDHGARDSVFVPFFGQPKATLATLGRLAKMLDAAVVPMYAWYDTDERRYQVKLDAPLEGFPTGDAHADALAMNRALERAIARCPAQYLWTYRLFRTRPDGTRLRYPRRRGRLRRRLRRQLRRRKRL